MRRTMMGLLAAAALGAAPVADGRAQTAQDTLGRVLEGLQGGQQDQRRDDRGYRDADRRRDERDTDRRGSREGDDRRPAAADSGRRADERQRRLDDDRRPYDDDRRRTDRDRR